MKVVRCPASILCSCVGIYVHIAAETTLTLYDKRRQPAGLLVVRLQGGEAAAQQPLLEPSDFGILGSLEQLTDKMKVMIDAMEETSEVCFAPVLGPRRRCRACTHAPQKLFLRAKIALQVIESAYQVRSKKIARRSLR